MPLFVAGRFCRRSRWTGTSPLDFAIAQQTRRLYNTK